MLTENEVCSEFERLRDDHSQWLHKKYRLQYADIDDVLQDALIKSVLQIREGYDGELEPFFKTIIQSVVRDRRKHLKRKKNDFDAYDPKEAEQIVDDDRTLEADEMVEYLRSKMKKESFELLNLSATARRGWATRAAKKESCHTSWIFRLVEKAKAEALEVYNA